jgi:stage II sporulation protein D
VGVRIVANGKLVRPGRSIRSIRRSGGAWIVGNSSLRANRLVVETIDSQPNKHVGFSGKTYHGKLVLTPRGPNAFIVVNHVNLDDYLAGVLAKELFGSWHVEAYRGLAVAARTFAYYNMMHSGSSGYYDLEDGVKSQVYGGIMGETTKSRQAVNSTRGWVLTANYRGKDRIFMPQYSSCCGGHVNAAIVLRDAPPIKPLQGGQADQHCTASSKYRWAPVRISKSELFRLLCGNHSQVRALGGLRTIQVAQKLAHGRAVWVNLIGVNGKTVRLRAEKIRLAMIFSSTPRYKKLYSMNCQIVDTGSGFEFRNGRGYGHGVGMCQYGLQGKALAGWRAEQIIGFYYPGAKIVKLY